MSSVRQESAALQFWNDQQERTKAFTMAMEGLYQQYPVPGNRDNPKKLKAILRVQRNRNRLLERYGYIFAASARRELTSSVQHMARELKLPEKQVVAIHTLIFPE